MKGFFLAVAMAIFLQVLKMKTASVSTALHSSTVYSLLLVKDDKIKHNDK